MKDFHYAPMPGTYGEIVEGRIHNYRMSAILENKGQTPTRKAVVNINKIIQPTKLTPEFDYPEGPKTEVADIGVGGTFNTLGFFMPIEEVEKVIAKVHGEI